MIRNGFDTQDTLSFESCMSSVACAMEEVSSEPSRKMQDKEQTTSEISVTAYAKRKEKWVEAGTRRRIGDAGSHSLVERGGRGCRDS